MDSSAVAFLVRKCPLGMGQVLPPSKQAKMMSGFSQICFVTSVLTKCGLL